MKRFIAIAASLVIAMSLSGCSLDALMSNASVIIKDKGETGACSICEQEDVDLFAVTIMEGSPFEEEILCCEECADTYNACNWCGRHDFLETVEFEDEEVSVCSGCREQYDKYKKDAEEAKLSDENIREVFEGMTGMSVKDAEVKIKEMGYTAEYLAANTKSSMNSSIEYDETGELGVKFKIYTLYDYNTTTKTVTFLVVTPEIKEALGIS